MVAALQHVELGQACRVDGVGAAGAAQGWVAARRGLLLLLRPRWRERHVVVAVWVTEG